MGLISNIYDGINIQPVNLMAASMLFNSHEWDIINNKLKIFIEQITPKESMISIDYFKTPISYGLSNVSSKIGIVFESCDEKFVVCGYAHVKKIARNANPSSRKNSEKLGYGYKGNNHKPAKKVELEHAWWCKNITTGQYVIRTGRTINKKIKIGFICDRHGA